METTDQPITLFGIVEDALKDHSNGVMMATKVAGNWYKMSPAVFEEKVRFTALGLYELGVRKGDRVSVHAENSGDWIVMDQAIMSIGAITVPIHCSLDAETSLKIIKFSEVRIHIVGDESFLNELYNEIKRLPNLLHIVSLTKSEFAGVLSLNEVINMGHELDQWDHTLFRQLRNKVNPDDLATIVFTSGREGTHKGVMLTHSNLTSNILACTRHVPFDAEKYARENVLSYLPLSHILERTMVYLYIHLKLCVYFIEHVEEIMEDMRQIQPVHFTTIPHFLEKMFMSILNRAKLMKVQPEGIVTYSLKLLEEYDVEHPFSGFKYLAYKLADYIVYRRIREAAGGKLISITCGGTALTAKIMNYVNGLGVYCGQGYGLTETSPVLTAYTPYPLKAGSVGKPLENVKIRIGDDEEICVKGPNVMKGYYNQPEMTRKAFTPDGWLKTGDTGYFDKDGYLYLTGRKKELFKLATGKFVDPNKLERLLEESQFIKQAFIVGHDKNFCAALIYPDYPELRKNQELKTSEENESSGKSSEFNLIKKDIERINQKLPEWEQISEIRFIDKLLNAEAGEQTESRQKRRQIILEEYKDLISEIYPNQG